MYIIILCVIYDSDGFVYFNLILPERGRYIIKVYYFTFVLDNLNNSLECIL